MIDDPIKLKLVLQWKEESKAWIAEATINPGGRGDQRHPTKPKVRIREKMAFMPSGEEYDNAKQAYEAARSKALARIRKDWGEVQEGKIKVTIYKQIGKESMQINVDELESGG